MKPEFTHAVQYNGETIAFTRTEKEAVKFHEALHHGGEEIEIVPPPPPQKFVGDSGIPAEDFESNGLQHSLLHIHPRDPEHLAEILKDHIIVSKDFVGGKVWLNVRKK